MHAHRPKLVVAAPSSDEEKRPEEKHQHQPPSSISSVSEKPTIVKKNDDNIYAYLPQNCGFGRVVSVDKERAVCRTSWGAFMYCPADSLQYNITVAVRTFVRLATLADKAVTSPSPNDNSIEKDKEDDGGGDKNKQLPPPASSSSAASSSPVPPPMSLLPPVVIPMNVNDRVAKIINALVKAYSAYGVEANEIRLVCGGHEVLDFTRPLYEYANQIKAPFHFLFVYAKFFSDFGGWCIVADNLTVSDDGLVLRNIGSDDKWRPARCSQAIGEDGGEYVFEVKIALCPPTANSWKICIGCVSTNFRETSDRAWIGSQPNSWAYIAGTGGVCHNSGQSAAYGEEFGEGDTIRVRMDFDKNEIEFFRNDVSQGVAFDNLTGPVYPAISFTATGATLQIMVRQAPNSMATDVVEDKSQDDSAVVVAEKEPAVPVPVAAAAEEKKNER